MWTVPSIPSTPPPWSIPQMRYHVPWLPYPTMPSVSTRRLRGWLKPWTPDDLFNPFSWKVCAVVVFFFAAVVAQGDGVGRSGTPVTCLSEALIEFPLVPEGHTLCNIQVERQKKQRDTNFGFYFGTLITEVSFPLISDKCVCLLRNLLSGIKKKMPCERDRLLLSCYKFPGCVRGHHKASDFLDTIWEKSQNGVKNYDRMERSGNTKKQKAVFKPIWFQEKWNYSFFFLKKGDVDGNEEFP